MRSEAESISIRNTQIVVICYQLSVVRGMRYEVKQNYLNTLYSILKLALNCPSSWFLVLGSWLSAFDFQLSAFFVPGS
jgi:hypothetical protein